MTTQTDPDAVGMKTLTVDMATPSVKTEAPPVDMEVLPVDMEDSPVVMEDSLVDMETYPTSSIMVTRKLSSFYYEAKSLTCDRQ